MDELAIRKKYTSFIQKLRHFWRVQTLSLRKIRLYIKLLLCVKRTRVWTFLARCTFRGYSSFLRILASLIEKEREFNSTSVPRRTRSQQAIIGGWCNAIHLRFTIWEIPRRWRNLAEQMRSGIFWNEGMCGEKALCLRHAVLLAYFLHSEETRGEMVEWDRRKFLGDTVI